MRAFVFLLLVACGTKEKPPMSMTDDHKRLAELERIKDPMQYGQTLQVEPAPGADLVLASKDLIRFVGEKTDLNAWRVYLGPWQPKPDIVVPPIIASEVYADPSPWAPPNPTKFDAFAPFPVYARINWGAGGIQHTAFVDWPRRGLLLQLSGSYLQVNAYVNTTSSSAHVPATVSAMPLLEATLGPEPGGGDAVNPATFTYPRQNAQDSGGGAQWFQNFQVPPFARAFTPVINFSLLQSSGASMVIATQAVPAAIGSVANNEIQVWRVPITAGNYDQALFTSIALPLAGQEVGNVRIEITPGGAGTPASFGCMFQLEL